MKILFIGNSYTFYNDLPKMFEALAKDNGKDVEAFSVTEGGMELLYFKEDCDVTRALDKLLSERCYDVCYIQEESTMPMKAYDRFESGLEIVLEKLKGKAQKIILFNTWGRKEGCTETLPDYGWTNESMTKGLYQGYCKAAEKFGLGISTVGLNFFDVNANYKAIDLYDEDRAHPSYKGSCLACLTHYYTLFGEFPENTDSLCVTKEEIDIFKNTVCEER